MSKFTQFCDEIGSVGVTLPEENFVALSLSGPPNNLDNYQDLVNGREKLPSLERLLSYLVREEIRQRNRERTSSKVEDEK